MEDQAAFWLATDIPTLTQVNSFSRQLWQPAVAMTMKLEDIRVHYDRGEISREDKRPDAFEPLAAWVHDACGYEN